MSPLGNGIIFPFTLLVVGGASIGASLTPVFGRSSSKEN